MKICPEQRDERGAFITTYSGAKFFVDECNIQDIPIADIAHALSMNCRFNGHVERFYSVAEHSCKVAELVRPEYKLTALLHDVSEAFVPDMPRPFKHYITGFDAYEDRIQEKLAEYYGIYHPLPEEVQHIDKNIVRDEAESLYAIVPDWIEYYESVCNPWDIEGWEPETAKARWLAMYWFYRLTR